MRILWTLIKVIVGLAIAIPLGILALALTVGLVGRQVLIAGDGMCEALVRGVPAHLACVGCVGYGAYRLLRFMLAPPPKVSGPVVRELSAPDPYYVAALRELDAELGTKSR